MKLKNRIDILQTFGLADLTVLNAKHSCKIARSISKRFLLSQPRNEIINSSSFVQSELLRKLYLQVFRNARSYIYTTTESGLSLVSANARQMLIKCLSIARHSIEKTCHVVDCDFTYRLRIRYHSGATLKEAYYIEMYEQNDFHNADM